MAKFVELFLRVAGFSAANTQKKRTAQQAPSEKVVGFWHTTIFGANQKLFRAIWI